MSRTITFQPGSDLDEFINNLITSGDYNNQSEVIRDALRLLREKNARSKLNQLRKLIDEGDTSGDPVSWNPEEFLSRMKGKRNAKKVHTKPSGNKRS